MWAHIFSDRVQNILDTQVKMGLPGVFGVDFRGYTFWELILGGILFGVDFRGYTFWS